MRVPESLTPLVEQGLIQEVIRPLRSGKEAQIYLVRVDDEERVAKVYKEAQNRTFKHRSQYTEGRTVRNTRDQRAMRRQSKYGKKRDESEWRSTEADIIFRLHAAEVQVPEPFQFVENVLIMAVVRDADGKPAPRLADVQPSRTEARIIFDHLLAETVRMLCSGVVHGDLSEFNVLMSAEGPVIIDFPQAVDPAKNRNAKKLLLRDVENLERILSSQMRSRRHTRYGQEIWGLYEKQLLTPDSRLTGRAPKQKSDPGGLSILAEMEALDRAARERRAALGLPPPRARTAIIREEPKPKPKHRTRSKPRPEPRSNTKSVPRSKPRHEAKSNTKPAPRSKPRPDAKSNSNPAPTSKPQGPSSDQPSPSGASRRRRRRRRRKPATSAES